MSKFIAVTAAGLRLVSVTASNEWEASREVVDQLDRPGRFEALNAWKRGGKQLVEERDLTVPACPRCGAKGYVITKNEYVLLGGHIECKCGVILHPITV